MQRETVLLAMMVLVYAAGCGQSQPSAPPAGNGGPEVSADDMTDPALTGGTANGHAGAVPAGDIDATTNGVDAAIDSTADPAADPTTDLSTIPTVDPTTDPAISPTIDPAADPSGTATTPRDATTVPGTTPDSKAGEAGEEPEVPKTVGTPQEAFLELNRVLFDRIQKRLNPNSGGRGTTTDATTPPIDPAVPTPETP